LTLYVDKAFKYSDKFHLIYEKFLIKLREFIHDFDKKTRIHFQEITSAIFYQEFKNQSFHLMDEINSGVYTLKNSQQLIKAIDRSF